jgi:predicted phage tail protein
MSLITGSGKSNPDGPSVTPELIRSIGTARIVDLICEGPIGGLVDGDSSIFLDDTPLRDPLSGSYNFINSTGTPAVSVIADRLGTPNQLSMPGFDQVESEVGVGAEVLHGQPVIRTVDLGADRIRLRLATPALYAIDGNGNTRENSISYVVEVKDSTQADFPPLSTVTESVTPVLLNIEPRFITVAGYEMVFEVDWSSLNTATRVMGQLKYSFVVLPPSGVGYEKCTKTMQIVVFLPGAGEVIRETIVTTGVLFAAVVDVYASPKIQFRFTSNYPLRRDPELPKWWFKGLFTTVQGGYSALLGPAFQGNHPTLFEASTYDYTLPGVGPWSIRVIKLTPDSADAKIQQTLQWKSYTEIIDSKLSYPNCAVFGVTASARQFSNIPRRSYLCKLLLVKVPSNYFPAYKNASGVWVAGKYTRDALGNDTGVEQGWDGTFYTAWTCNPAWCYYNLVTHPRYGLGRYISQNNVNKWELYTIGRYSDGMVASGYKDANGQDILEPRFTLNCYVATRGQAYALLQSLTSAFRGMVYWAAGKVTAIQDSPSDPVHEFANSNVIGGRFSYAGTAKRARHNAALVTWNDPTDNFKQATEYVDDPDGIRRYGFNPITINTFGCTSRGQAHRFGKWAIYSELHETETCTLQTGLEGTHVVPGNLFKVADSGRSGVRWGGRVLRCLHDLSTTTITLDSSVNLLAGHAYTVTLVDLTQVPVGLVTKNIDPGTGGDFDALTFVGLVDVAAGQPWILESPNTLEAQLFRCLSVTEDSMGVFQVIGISHNPGKFAWVEQGVVFDEPPISGQLPATTIILPTGVLLSTKDIVGVAGALERHLYLTWDISPQSCIRGYEAQYSRDQASWVKVTPNAANKCDIVNPPAGSYVAQVRSINVAGVASEWVTTSLVVEQRVDVAPNVTGLQLLGQGNNAVFLDRDAQFSWNQVLPPNVVSNELGDDSYGVGAAFPTDWLAGYQVLIYNQDGSLRRTDFTRSEQFSYSFDKNCQDGNGVPVRTFTVAIAAKTVWGTFSPVPARLSVSNPAPAVLT